MPKYRIITTDPNLGVKRGEVLTLKADDMAVKVGIARLVEEKEGDAPKKSSGSTGGRKKATKKKKASGTSKTKSKNKD